MRRAFISALQVGGTNFQSASMIVPGNGFLVGVKMCCCFAAVTTSAEFVAIVSAIQFLSAADFDANLGGKEIIDCVRVRVGFVTSGLANESVNVFTPISNYAVKSGQSLYLQSNSATVGINGTAILHFLFN